MIFIFIIIIILSFHKAETKATAMFIAIEPNLNRGYLWLLHRIYQFQLSISPIQIRCTIDRTIGLAWQILATLKALVGTTCTRVY
ncbi:hypothetical protein BDV38DRAFT_186448 [Aspergillus pseudotamarii]|uniref:Secreted protein n=1 Tax=Aspergillus pseudotamarii TaxID=132259 RepID=A0A5N6SHT6_ASPPS|nr:uncharacterized protein BDV38DRAFT_186448 [Aspergillus pseudotamarii]KAE8133300.1 hypothetical protein BDV38DRAFT_186448 [Aspergillus pseudotamarii]